MALKASPTHQALLLELQALDTKLQQLAHRVNHLPETALLTTISVDSERLRLRRAAESGAVEDAQTELSRVESDVTVVAARIARDTDRLQASSSVKDVAGLESELAGLTRRRDELEEIELAVMEKLEVLEQTVSVTTAELTEILARVEGLEVERDAAAAAITLERSNAVVSRADIVGGLPEELIALYDRQRLRYGFGASHLRGGVSSASGVKLLENELEIIRAASADDVLICPDSQAILVRTKESGLFPQKPIN